MFGVPHLTLDVWKDSLQRAIDLGVDHLSVYGLHVYETTAFGRRHREGRLTLPDEERQREMYYGAIDMLAAAGYEQYEVRLILCVLRIFRPFLWSFFVSCHFVSLSPIN